MDTEDEAACVAATVAGLMQRIEIVGERHRNHDAAFRAMVVEQAGQPGSRVQDVARRHGICSSLVYRWRRAASPQAGAGSAVQLLPVRVADPRAEMRASPRPPSSSTSQTRPGLPRSGLPRSGLIEIEFEGGIRVRVDGDVSLAALRRVVAALRR
jgi:transposase